MLLILSYQSHGIESAIKGTNGLFVMLDSIIDDAKSNPILSLSRNTKFCLGDFRKLGNFSAHKIYYNCKRDDLKRVLVDFRAIIEELLYKAGIKN